MYHNGAFWICSMRLLRRSERVIVVYFAYAALLSQFLPLKQPIPAVTLFLNLTIIAGYFLLGYADSFRRRAFLGIVRDWYPLPLLLLAYREMGWFRPEHHAYRLEQVWVVWDRYFLNNFGGRAVIESLGPLIPSVLEVSYSLVYAIPSFSVAMIYSYRRRERTEQFLFPFVLAVLFCYALFPYFPSEPPRTVFPGQDFPSWNTIFRRFNWGLLGGYGIHTSVFPSAHVAAAFAAAFAIRRVLAGKRWVCRALAVLAVLIAAATVYGRYHYLADAAAGFAIAVAAAGLTGAFGRDRVATSSPGPSS